MHIGTEETLALGGRSFSVMVSQSRSCGLKQAYGVHGGVGGLEKIKIKKRGSNGVKKY